MEEFNIKVKMNKHWIPHFLGMLKAMQYLGNIGSSREIKFFSDGDGSFRPKFEFNTNIEPVKYIKDAKKGEAILFFDAG